jgi:hypothetical protein
MPPTVRLRTFWAGQDDSMNRAPEAPDVDISLNQDKALVLFEWLTAFNKSEPTFSDQAEQRVLWDVEALLERALDALFRSDYESLLANARSRVRDKTD